MKKRITACLLTLALLLGIAPLGLSPTAQAATSEIGAYSNLVQNLVNKYGAYDYYNDYEGSGVKSVYCADLFGDSAKELFVAWYADEDFESQTNFAFYGYENGKVIELYSDSSFFSGVFQLTMWHYKNGDFAFAYEFMNISWIDPGLTKWNGHSFETTYDYNGLNDEPIFGVSDGPVTAFYLENKSFKSVDQWLAATYQPSNPGFDDVLSTLSPREKALLFDQLLLNVLVSGGPADYRTISDENLIICLETMILNTSFPFESYGGIFGGWDYQYKFTENDFSKMTSELFGRNINYNKFAGQPDPNAYGYGSFWKQNFFYLFMPQRGYIMIDRSAPKHLYALDANTFCAEFEHYQHDYETSEALAGVYSAIVKKNPNGTWRLLKLYSNCYTPTTDELSAFVAPSSWAKAEVEAADAAGLIPDLSGDPGWQDASTRLQFCQMAVQLAETALGKTLPAAPANTFTDCSDLAVRKAYAAGIVNGMTETTFSPNGTLTREQLATMLWRAVKYIQTESGQQTLTGGGSLTGYTDAGSVSAYAKEAVSALNKNGIMKGTSNTALSPKGSCTVEQSVLLSYRTFLKFN